MNIKALFFGIFIFILLTSNIVLAEKFVFNRKQTNITLEEQTSNFSLINIFSTNIKIEEIFTLDSPARLVLDLKNIKLDRNYSFDVKSSSHIKAIRTGQHDPITRIVFDLKQEKIPYYQYKIEKQKLSIQISFSNNLDVKESNAIKISHNNKPLQNKTVKEKTSGEIVEQLHSTPIKKETILPENKADSKAKTIKKAISNKKVTNVKHVQAGEEVNTQPKKISNKPVVLTGFTFDYEEDRTPYISISLSNKTHFSFIQKNPRKYLLTIKNCTPKNSILLNPFMAPMDHDGFDLILPKLNGKNMDIEVYIERNVNLSAIPIKKEIQIKKIENNER